MDGKTKEEKERKLIRNWINVQSMISLFSLLLPFEMWSRISLFQFLMFPWHIIPSLRWNAGQTLVYHSKKELQTNFPFLFLFNPPTRTCSCKFNNFTHVYEKIFVCLFFWKNSRNLSSNPPASETFVILNYVGKVTAHKINFTSFTFVVTNSRLFIGNDGILLFHLRQDANQ